MPASDRDATDPTAVYLRLMRVDLPAAARAAADAGRPWPIRLDHCFMRVVLDDLFGRPWREALTGRGPAYRQLSAEQLRRAIATGESMIAGGANRVRTLNDASLNRRTQAGV